MTLQPNPISQFDLQGGIVLSVVEIAVSPERVFTALTTPKDILRWWGSPESYRLTSWTANVTIGGAWRAEGLRHDGKTFATEGIYLEIDPPFRLVKTWKSCLDDGPDTTVTYELEAIEGGTRLTVRHDGFSGRESACQDHAKGWEAVLGWLTAYTKVGMSG